MSTSYQILYWRDIPAQIKLRNGKQRTSRSLSDRFQQAIDSAAMLARTTSTDDYLDEWRSSDWMEREGEADAPADAEASAIADAIVAEIEAAYSPDRLQTLVFNKGLAS
jgi:hypothetical protein